MTQHSLKFIWLGFYLFLSLSPSLVADKKHKREFGMHRWREARQEAYKAKPLNPQQALKRMTTMPGIEATLFASEPQVEQPIAFCWDDRGRLWIAENLNYTSRTKGFSKEGKSRISILEDSDGDGKMDIKKVFLDHIPFPSGIAVGHGGLWLAAPPNLYFVPDRNQDDKADDQIEVRLSGWGIKDRHEVLNSLSWGPDGWLYGCQGFATPSKVGKPKGKKKIYQYNEAFPKHIDVQDPQYIDGGIWRYHPSKDRFEVFAHGFSNPWGIDWNDKGQLFTSVCVIPHLWHVIQGGIYHRQGGRHISPYVYSDIKTITDHRHRSAHGGIRIYQADLFPKQYYNRAIMANIHDHHVTTDILHPKGSGYVGKHGDEIMEANDPHWIGFSVETGPEGAIYILDWHDIDICGNSVRQKNTGRVYRLAPPNTKGKTGFDLNQNNEIELLDLQLHNNNWYSRRARVILQHRALEDKLSSSFTETLWNRFNQAKELKIKLRYLWTLHVTQSIKHHQVLDLLQHSEAYIRAWAIQFVCEDHLVHDTVYKKLIHLAKEDPSPVVRLYIASAMKHLKFRNIWPIANALLSHRNDANDHNIPKMIWFAIEPYVSREPGKALNASLSGNIPLVSNFIVRRLTEAQKVDFLVARLNEQTQSKNIFDALHGLKAGLRGKRNMKAPKGWLKWLDKVQTFKEPRLVDLSMQLSQIFGMDSAFKAQLAMLQNKQTPLAKRKEIIANLSGLQYHPLVNKILGELKHKQLRIETLRALAFYHDKRVPACILEHYQSYSLPEKSEALMTLSSRKTYAEALWKAIKEKQVLVQDIPTPALRQLKHLLGPAFTDDIGKADHKIHEKMLHYKKILSPKFLAKANLKQGKQLFQQSCQACHILHGQGGKIGPELTGANREDLDYLLLNILNPNEEIAESYKMTIIKTQDGRILTGNIVSENKTKLVLNMVGQKLSLEKSQILSRSVSPQSMMPEGLLNHLNDKQVRDLIAYLQKLKDIK